MYLAYFTGNIVILGILQYSKDRKKSRRTHMSKRENAIVTVLCMVYDENKILLQDRVKKDWRGLTFPGGHVEKGFYRFIEGI